MIDAYGSAGRSPANDWLFNQPNLPFTAPQVKPVAQSNAGRLAYSSPGGAPILDSGSGSWSSPDGKVLTGGSYVRYKDQINGSDWYLADEQQASGRSYDTNRFFPDRLTSVYTHVNYTSGNSFVHIAPDITRPIPSDCTSTTVSVNRTIGYSYTQNSCINRNSLSPIGGMPYPFFGASWDGAEDGCAREGEVAEDLLHSPPGASLSMTFYVIHDFNNPNYNAPNYC